MRTVEKADCFLSRYRLLIKLDKLLRENISDSSRCDEHETVVEETLRRRFSNNGVYKFAYVVSATAK